MRPRVSGLGVFPRYGGGWMHQFGHVYALQHELLNPQAGSWFRAIELWHTARHEGVALNSAHYTNILRQCVQPAAWEASLNILRQMRREGIRPDVVGVGCVLAACADANKGQEVESVFNAFCEKMALDSVCYLALIKARISAGRWEDAMAVGKLQKTNGVCFLPYTYTYLLEAANEADEGVFALELVRQMREEQWVLCEKDCNILKNLSARFNWETEFDQLLGDHGGVKTHYQRLTTYS